MGITILPKTRRMQDGEGNPLSSYEDEAGHNSLDIHDSDVHTILINRHFIDFDSATENPTVAIVAGDYVVLVASTAGFVAGTSHIVIRDVNGDVFEHHFEVIAITADTSITLNRPIDNDYPVTASLEVVVMHMNSVVGSLVAPIIYSVKPPSNQIWHLTRLILSVTDQSAMDDALFGGVSALTNGVVLLENRTTNKTFTSWTTNAEMKEDMYDVHYSLKAPAGFYGLVARWTFKNAGVAVRLDGSLGDSLNIMIQDDLTALDSFTAKIQGHIE